MNEKLIVKNFGPIKNAKLDLKKVTIFIGPQGSGKSTLAKLVAICKEDEIPLLSDKEIPISFRVMDYGIEDYKSKNTSFQYHSTFNTISYGKNGYLKSPKELGTKIELEIIKIRETIELFKGISSATNNSNVLANYIEFKKILKTYKILEPIYFPIERFLIASFSSSLFGMLNNKINLPKIITEFGHKYEVARTTGSNTLDMQPEKIVSGLKFKLRTKDIEIFDIEFLHENGQDYIIDKKDNYKINLNVSSSGMQSAIPLIIVVNHEYIGKESHFIVEEPELNLYPTTQKQLVGYLADKCTQNDNELLMTTHSPYVLSALNNLLFAYQVAHVLPERADEIAEIIPKNQWLNPDDFEAYYVGEDDEGNKGGIRSIFNKKTGLIGQNELDSISEELGDEFDALMNIYRTRKRETIN